MNALKIVNKKKEKIKVVVNGVGAAGVAITKLLHLYGVKNIFLVDSKGLVCTKRKGLNTTKKKLINNQAHGNVCGSLSDALLDADVFIGVSAPDILGKDEIQRMAQDPIIFALANPNPEIKPELAKKLGVRVLATGRSDYPNQINNVLVFQEFSKERLKEIKNKLLIKMKLQAAKALAAHVKKPRAGKIIPGPFEKGIAHIIAQAVSGKK